jgi:serine/threonine protein kinase
MAINLFPLEHRLALPGGFQLDRYRIRRVLGSGGFGITYLAEARPYPEVAIKELFPKDFATRSDGHRVIPHGPSAQEKLDWAKQRFLDEARILERLHHPNIVPVERYFELLDTAYLVMKFILGDHLHQWIKARPRLTEQELQGILLPLLDGLEYIHQQNFLHRDVSPENIIVTPEGLPILVDFGSARKAISSRSLTTVVRPGYSPIEQYQKTTPQGPYTDIYALAGILVHAITRKEPPQAVDRAGARDRFTPLAARFRNQYSKRFLEAIDAGFAVSPERRPQNIAAWRQMFPKSEPPKVRRKPKTRPRPAVTPAVKPIKPKHPVQHTIEKKAKGAHTTKRKNQIWLVWIPLVVAAGVTLITLAPKIVVFPIWVAPSPTPVPDPSVPSVSITPTPPLVATKGHPFVNSLGMKFVPINVGDKVVLFCIHQTRRSDYQAVMGELPDPALSGLASNGATADAPVVYVTQAEASRFCEQLARRPDEGHGRVYRLPTIEEWDRAFDHPQIPWPPLKDGKPLGNYLDEQGISFLIGPDTLNPNISGHFSAVPNYNDGFATTAPVMHFENQNASGLYDMGSNVDEWCSDQGLLDGDTCVYYKGASWMDYDQHAIQNPTTSHKEYPKMRLNYVGFRCVLEVH